jgi:hypothetical protein
VATPSAELPAAGRRLPAERDDLLLLAAAIICVPLGWLLLGWRWPLCVSGYDAWATALPLLQALGAGRGDWDALAYRPDLLGGVRLRDTVGPNPLVALLARAGLSATGVYDLAAFALQALIGFFGARTAADLLRTWRASGVTAGGEWTARGAALVPCAFAPFLGWRLGYGHLFMTTGLLPFAAALALTAAAGARRMTVTLGVVSALAAANGLLFTGHQLVLYGAVFGAPLLAGLWLSARAPLRALMVPAAALTLGALLAWPALLGVLQQALGTDAPRSPSGMRITYSYLTAGPLDWLSSLPWTTAAIPRARPLLQHHESNVPLGPLVALLALAPWRRLRPLAWGLGLAALLLLVFSLDLRPFSTLLIATVPPLGSFRVPTRAALPLWLALPPMATAAVLHAATARGRPSWGRTLPAAAAAFLALFLLPPLPRELLGWATAAALVFWGWRRLPPPAPIAVAALLVLGGGALGAFGERLLTPFRDTDALLAEARARGAAAAALHPGLRDPLVRLAVRANLPELGANTAFAAGLSSLDGYFFPTRRLIALVAALRHQPYQPSAFVVRVHPDEPAARVLFPLYNVRWQAGSGALSTLSVPAVVPPPRVTPLAPWSFTPLGPTPGAAWFSTLVEALPSLESLATALYAAGDALPESLRGTVWTVNTDPKAHELPRPGGSCSTASVNSVTASRGGRFSMTVSAPADCPLTLATNFAELLEARVRVGDRWQSARTFPAYGALLGVWVPGGATEVVIAPR